MEFVNETPFPADLFRSELEQDVMYGALVVRIRYRLVEGQPLLPVADGLRDLRRALVEDDYARLEPDEFHGRTGTDLIVLGDARPPAGPVASMNLRVNAGAYDLNLRVTGDRVWERRYGVGGLRPSAPTPFASLPITYRNTFGGQAPSELGAVPYPENPTGKGFYLSETDAIHQPLPHVEAPDAPIRAWNDHPIPVGTAPYPPTWALRLRKALAFDPVKRRPRLKPDFYDRAHPELSGKPLRAGDWVRLEGFNGHPRLAFRLPDCSLAAEIRLGSKCHPRQPSLEEVLVDLRTTHVDLTYRKRFHYRIRPRELRRTTLRAA